MPITTLWPRYGTAPSGKRNTFRRSMVVVSSKKSHASPPPTASPWERSSTRTTRDSSSSGTGAAGRFSTHQRAKVTSPACRVCLTSAWPWEMRLTARTRPSRWLRHGKDKSGSPRSRPPSPPGESWNGKTWTIGAPVGPKNGSLGLTGVSCPSANNCVAVGYTINRLNSPSAFAESWNGQAWSPEKLPTPPGGAEVYDVSCSSSDACVAVGGRGNGTLAEGWNGEEWTVEKTANPTGSQGSGYLDGVACSASACTAVGYYTDTTGNAFTLVETKS